MLTIPARLALLAACALLALPACRRTPPPEPPGPPGPTVAEIPKRPPPAEIWKEFSGERAFAHVQHLVELGPHPSGSDALETARQYLVTTLAAAGWSAERQEFTDQTPTGPIRFVNLVARLTRTPASSPRVVVISHYDTKFYDTIRFVGANDSGSSTGALLELARVLALDPDFAQQIELLFTDGEEAIQQFTPTDGLYGSRHYVRVLQETNRLRQFRYGILWDMMGDRNLRITLPPDSPGELARAAFAASETLGLRQFFTYHTQQILDDHTPFNQAGVPVIDLIDFDFPAWHTADDQLDQISPESLQRVGAVTLYLLKHTPP
jgi:glutaminyl-peptide cyclotransferase